MEDLLNKKYTVELEVLTPLHVGAGSEKDWMKGADFIEDKRKVYVLNQRKLLKYISVDELSNFLVKKDDRGLKNKISGSPETVSDLIFNSPASTDNDIKVFIKNGLTNKPIVPGSSIKGAIRSILLNHFLNGKKPNRLDEKTYFGSSTDGDEFMRFIKISDTDFDKTELINTKIFNLFGTTPNLNGGWKHELKGGTNGTFKQTGFNTIYEVIKPNSIGELSISISEKQLKNFNLKKFYENELIKAEKIFDEKKRHKKVNTIKTLQKTIEKKQKLVSENINSVFAIINQHTKAYIDKEIAFFKKYSNGQTVNIIQNLEYVKSQIPADNSSCVLKMSAGSGFHSITGDWQFDDFSINGVAGGRVSRGQLNRQDSAKSRKIAVDGDNFYLMGFVKLSILSDEVIAQREEERRAKIEEERRIETERIANEKAEIERIEAEKRAKEEAERKAEEERIDKEKRQREERERILKQREEEEKEREQVNLKKLDKGLVLLESEDNYNKGKNFIVKFKKKNNGISTDQVKFIEVFVKKHYLSEDKEWSNFNRGKRWKDIKGWVGQDTAKKWFDEINESITR